MLNTFINQPYKVHSPLLLVIIQVCTAVLLRYAAERIHRRSRPHDQNATVMYSYTSSSEPLTHT